MDPVGVASAHAEEWTYDSARGAHVRGDGTVWSYPSRRRYPAASDLVVLDEDFADPTVVEIDGAFYMYGTSTTRVARTRSAGGSEDRFVRSGELVTEDYEEVPVHAQVARSTDLRGWELLYVDALEGLPGWLPQGRNVETFAWASHPVVVGSGTIRLYYSLVVKTYADATRTGTPDISSHISVALADRPEGPFRDTSTAPIISGVGSRCVDPFVSLSDGRWTLVLGSDAADITEHALTADGTRLRVPEEGRTLLAPVPGDAYRRVHEAPYLFRDLLLTSGADCFANDKLSGHVFADDPDGRYDWYRYGGYAVLQATRDERTGRYASRRDQDGRVDDVVLEGNDDIKNPGNSCVITSAGRTVLFGHLIDRAHQYFSRTPLERERKANRRPPFAVDVVVRSDGSLQVPGGQFSRDHRGPEHSVRHFR